MSASLTPNFDDQKNSKTEETEKSSLSPKTKFQILSLLLGIVMAFAVGEGFYSWSLTNRIQGLENDLQTRISSQDANLQQLQDQMGMQEKQLGMQEKFSDDLRDEVTAARTGLVTTRGEIQKTKTMADELAKQQKQTAEQFSSELGKLQEDQEATKGSVGSLSSDVTGVKQVVSATKDDLASAKSELQRTIGDLGVQSGLIATNRQELEELKLLGARTYVEFDLRKTSQPQRYSDAKVALQLKKTDLKRQKYTFNLISDDRTIEKKDKNTNEPVQFYQQGYRIPSEIVVNQIFKDRILGYISVPRQKSATQMGRTGSPMPTTQSGS